MRRTGMSRVMATPLGDLTLLAGPRGISAVLFGAENALEAESPGLPDAATIAALDVAERQIDEYFGGRRTSFDLPLDQNGSQFQQKVWAALVAIPFGQTRSYGTIAGTIGRPRAAQAVGLACGSNPFAIVVPCHRVVGANGRLTGYPAGLPHKRMLIEFEHGGGTLF
jgi:methylated-DNA-[protein]-cysteine S-methyltransferase